MCINNPLFNKGLRYYYDNSYIYVNNCFCFSEIPIILCILHKSYAKLAVFFYLKKNQHNKSKGNEKLKIIQLGSSWPDKYCKYKN